MTLNTLLAVGAEFLAVAGAITLSLLLMLVARSKRSPLWLKGDLASMLICVGVVSMVAVSIAWLASGLTSILTNGILAVGVACLIWTVLFFALWQVIRMRTRLARADAGLPIFGNDGTPLGGSGPAMGTPV